MSQPRSAVPATAACSKNQTSPATANCVNCTHLAWYSRRATAIGFAASTVPMLASKAMQLAPCRLAEHGAAILEILNDAIATSTALYDYAPRAPESMVGWFEAKRAGDFPVW